MTKENENPTSSKNKIDATVLVALISLVGTIIVVLFGFPPFQELFGPKPTTTIEPTLTATFIYIAITSETNVPTGTFTLVSPIETITLTPTPLLNSGMYVSLVANQTRGRIPLNVKINTKNTIFRDATGAEFQCGACNYTWQVRQGGNIIFGPQQGQATFEYTFRSRGTYFVTVLICRNQSDDCGSSGAQIVAE